MLKGFSYYSKWVKSFVFYHIYTHTHLFFIFYHVYTHQLVLQLLYFKHTKTNAIFFSVSDSVFFANEQLLCVFKKNYVTFFLVFIFDYMKCKRIVYKYIFKLYLYCFYFQWPWCTCRWLHRCCCSYCRYWCLKGMYKLKFRAAVIDVDTLVCWWEKEWNWSNFCIYFIHVLPNVVLHTNKTLY